MTWIGAGSYPGMGVRTEGLKRVLKPLRGRDPFGRMTRGDASQPRATG
jgi:hypothetical protein